MRIDVLLDACVTTVVRPYSRFIQSGVTPLSPPGGLACPYALTPRPTYKLAMKMIHTR